MLRWSWCAKKPWWSPIFQRCLNVNGPKYAAGHLLAEVFSYITVRPVFVNTHQRDSARESGRRPLRWKDGCYIPSQSQLAPSLLNCGAALIFSASAAQIDLGALTSSNYSSRSSNAGTSQNARALKNCGPHNRSHTGVSRELPVLPAVHTTPTGTRRTPQYCARSCEPGTSGTQDGVQMGHRLVVRFALFCKSNFLMRKLPV